MTHQDWTDRLRDRMADYEAATPEGLWADIEKSLPQPKATLRPLYLRWVSVAAVVALLVGTGWWLWWPDGDKSPSSITQHPSPITHHLTPATHHPVVPDEKPANLMAQQPAVAVSHAQLAVSAERTEEGEHATYNNHVTYNNNKEQLADSVLEDRPKTLPAVTVSTKVEPSLPDTPPIKKKVRSINVGLYANNGLLAYHHTNGVQMSDDMAKRYDFSDYMPTRAPSPDDPIYLTGYEERQHHDHPVSLGLTVAYPLSIRWTIESGLVYTRLHSEFTNVMQQTQINKEQTLHYLGLPLHLQYLLLNNRHWTIYAKAGAQVDWNFRAMCETEGVDTQMEKDYAQWSLGGAVGLEYDLFPALGIYAEPGFRYYFDNGSKVQNYFKDQPANWSLQLGIRLRLNQR